MIAIETSMALWRTETQPNERLRRSALLLATIVVSAVVYWHIIFNYFWSDDFIYLYELCDHHQLIEFLFGPHGGHVQLFKNAIVYLSYIAFGLEPQWYYGAVFVTHLVNVALLYRLIRLFTGSPHLACFGALLWGAAPSNEATLGWYAVYGQVIVALLLLAVMVGVARMTADDTRRLGRAPYCWCLAMLTASVSFGVGIAIALVFPLVAVLLLPAARRRRSVLVTLFSLIAVVPAVYVAAHWMYSLTPGGLTPADSPLSGTAFLSGPEVLLRLSLWRWRETFTMLIELIVVGMAGTLLGNSPWAVQSPTVFGYGATAGYVAIVLVTFRQSPRRVQRQIAACAIIAGGSYGVIALGRAGLYAGLAGTVAGATAPRYQYVATIPLAVVTCLVLKRVGEWARISSLWTDVAVATWVLWVLVSFLRWSSPPNPRSWARQEVAEVVSTVNALVARESTDDPVYIQNRRFNAIGVVTPPAVFPGWAGAFVVFFPENVVQGKRVYFVEPDAKTIAAIRMRPATRSASLLVSPAEVGR